MDKRTAELLYDAVEKYGRSDVAIVDDYSGRGMFGQYTHALINTTVSEILTCLLLAIQSGDIASGELEGVVIKGFRYDSLGYDQVIY